VFGQRHRTRLSRPSPAGNDAAAGGGQGDDFDPDLTSLDNSAMQSNLK
jgi:hypothetical protein